MRWICLISLLLCVSCGRAAVPGEAATSTQPAAASMAWATARPEEEGLDTGAIAEMDAALDADALDLHSLLIVRRGKIVYERYWAGYQPDRLHEMYSVTKSVIGTLVGIAIDQGRIEGVELPVADWLDGMAFQTDDPRKAAMTLEDLLTMRSGLDWQEADASFQAMYRSGNLLDWTLALPMAGSPGETFAYCSACSHVLSAAVERATGRDVLDFAQETLFGPLGFGRLEWEQAPEGTRIGGWGLQLTPRDMARLGQLYLQEGRWNGTQVVSAEWVRAATTAHTGTDGEMDYGYQWWIIPGQDAYAALGRFGQTIYVIPKFEMVIVTTAAAEGHDQIFSLIEQQIVTAVED